MKSVLAIILTMAIYLPTWAQEESAKKPVPEGYGTLPMENVPSAYSQKSKVNFTTSCTDSTGRAIQQGEAGFETCMGDVKLKSLNSPSKDTTTSPNMGPQMNMNIKVGN